MKVLRRSVRLLPILLLAGMILWSCRSPANGNEDGDDPGIDRVNADLYVSPAGDSTNSGLSASEPLGSLTSALALIFTDSLNPHTIYLADGIYSPSTTGEKFTLYPPSYISLIGESEQGVVIDADGYGGYGVFQLEYNLGIQFENMTIKGGFSLDAGGINVKYSDLRLKDVTLTGNVGKYGGAMGIEYSTVHFEQVTIANSGADCCGGGIKAKESSIYMENVDIINNHATEGVGGFACENCLGSMTNVRIQNNHAISTGGMSFSGPISMLNVLVSGNSSTYGTGGISASGSGEAQMVNVLVYGNSTGEEYGGGLSSGYDKLTLMNSIIWNNSPDNVLFGSPPGDPNTLSISYCNIQGGSDSIGTNEGTVVNWLEGNLATDPMFVDPVAENFHLRSGSPCIDAGHPDAEYRDSDGSRNDMGTYGGPNGDWE